MIKTLYFIFICVHFEIFIWISFTGCCSQQTTGSFTLVFEKTQRPACSTNAPGRIETLLMLAEQSTLHATRTFFLVSQVSSLQLLSSLPPHHTSSQFCRISHLTFIISMVHGHSLIKCRLCPYFPELKYSLLHNHLSFLIYLLFHNQHLL